MGEQWRARKKEVAETQDPRLAAVSSAATRPQRPQTSSRRPPIGAPSSTTFFRSLLVADTEPANCSKSPF
jgi:hypothetical protein